MTAEEDVRKASKAANDLKFDNEGYKEMMSGALYNILTEFTHPVPKKAYKDEFTERYIQPLLKPFFNEHKYIVIYGNKNESRGSKIRREGEGLMSDYGLKAVYTDFEHKLLYVEIKGPNQFKDIQSHHPGFRSYSST